MSRVKWLLGFVAALTLASFGATMVVWAVWPYEDLLIRGESVLTSGDQAYKPGDRITFERPEGVCNFGTGPQSVFRWIEYQDGNRIGLPENPLVSENPPQGCVTNSTVETVVPLVAQRNGEWRFRFDTSYKPNPLRTITVTSYSAWFEVAR